MIISIAVSCHVSPLKCPHSLWLGFKVYRFGETSPGLYADQFWEQILLPAECGHFRSGCFCLNFHLTNFLLSAFIYNFLWLLNHKILLIGFNHWEVLIAVLYSVVKTLVIIIEGNYKWKLLLLFSQEALSWLFFLISYCLNYLCSYCVKLFHWLVTTGSVLWHE